MIDAHMLGLALIGFARQVVAPVEKWKPSHQDAKEMREGMKEFETKVINGRKWYPFEQYCASKNLIKAGSKGEFVVLYHQGWQQAMDTKELMDWQDWQDREAVFAAMPEEREIYEAKLEGIRKEIRALVGSTVEHSKVVT